MQVTNQGSVRVDLVGGTLDIEPINLIIKKRRDFERGHGT